MLKAKKSLGQNFLKDQKIAEEIVEAGEIKPGDVVLEVGPGKGILTEILLKKAKKVVAIEKDERLVEFLREKFAEEIKNGKLELICGDILKLSTLYSLPSTFKIIANLPYYLTSFFLRKFLSDEHQPSLMVLMIQKEVTERIVGRKGEAKRNFSRFTLPRNGAGSDASQNFALPRPFSAKESLLSISVKAYGKPEIIRKVSAGNFSPAPKVDSAVIKILGISKDFFKEINEKDFFELVKKGFSQKRKMLINNLGLDKQVFGACGVPEKARAENLSLEQWGCLVRQVHKVKS